MLQMTNDRSSSKEDSTLIEDFLQLQKRCETVKVFHRDELDSMLQNMETITRRIANAINIRQNSTQRMDAIDMLRELMKCSTAAFVADKALTTETRPTAVKGKRFQSIKHLKTFLQFIDDSVTMTSPKDNVHLSHAVFAN